MRYLPHLRFQSTAQDRPNVKELNVVSEFQCHRIFLLSLLATSLRTSNYQTGAEHYLLDDSNTQVRY